MSEIKEGDWVYGEFGDGGFIVGEVVQWEWDRSTLFTIQTSESGRWDWSNHEGHNLEKVEPPEFEVGEEVKVNGRRPKEIKNRRFVPNWTDDGKPAPWEYVFVSDRFNRKKTAPQDILLPCYPLDIEDFADYRDFVIDHVNTEDFGPKELLAQAALGLSSEFQEYEQCQKEEVNSELGDCLFYWTLADKFFGDLVGKYSPCSIPLPNASGLNPEKHFIERNIGKFCNKSEKILFQGACPEEVFKAHGSCVSHIGRGLKYIIRREIECGSDNEAVLQIARENAMKIEDRHGKEFSSYDEQER